MEWRIVPGFPDYAVSSAGDIKRVGTSTTKRKPSGAPLRAASSRSGYLHVTLCHMGMKAQLRVNRIVCAAFHGQPPSPMHHAAHNDGNRKNNSARNLRWALPVENEADKIHHGTAAGGERHWSKTRPHLRAKGVGHGLAKLNDDDVRSICNDPRKQRDIAAEYGVTQRVIWSVKSGKTWSHVE